VHKPNIDDEKTYDKNQMSNHKNVLDPGMESLKPIIETDFKNQVFFDELGYPVDTNFSTIIFEQSLSPINPTLSLAYHSIGSLETLLTSTHPPQKKLALVILTEIAKFLCVCTDNNIYSFESNLIDTSNS
jgi:hypothetical protein